MKKISIALLILILTFSSVGVFAATTEDGIIYDGSKNTGYSGTNTDIYIPSLIDKTIVITTVGKDAFKNKGIQSVEVGEGIKRIEEGAFEGSSLIFCVLPKTLERLDNNAFKSCRYLSAIVFQSETCVLGKDSLKGTSNDLNVSVPCSADLNAWKNNIANAKGDTSFLLVPDHEWTETNLKDANGNKVQVCEHCGVYSAEPVENIPFTDVPSKSWYYSAVATAYSYGIINGVTLTTFEPEKNMTRAEAVKIAAMIYSIQMDSTRETANALLQKSKESKVWYEPYIDYGLLEGFIPLDSEMAGDDFDWSKNATRDEMAFLFANADRNTEIKNRVAYNFIPDVDESTKYGPEILALYQRGVAQGSDATHRYKPGDNVKRNEVATFITRLMVDDTRITF